jgi:hypothetical protein
MYLNSINTETLRLARDILHLVPEFARANCETALAVAENPNSTSEEIRLAAGPANGDFNKMMFPLESIESAAHAAVLNALDGVRNTDTDASIRAQEFAKEALEHQIVR